MKIIVEMIIFSNADQNTYTIVAIAVLVAINIRNIALNLFEHFAQFQIMPMQMAQTNKQTNKRIDSTRFEHTLNNCAEIYRLK